MVMSDAPTNWVRSVQVYEQSGLGQTKSKVVFQIAIGCYGWGGEGGSVESKCQSLKYQRFTISSCNIKGMIKK